MGRLTSALAGIVVIALTAVPGATAAVEFGDACVADASLEVPANPFAMADAANPLPAEAPLAGVLTRFRLSTGGGAGESTPVTFKVLRLSPGPPQTATVIGEATGPVTGGANEVGARIPVQPGDRVSQIAGGSLGPLLCSSPVESSIGYIVNGVVGAPPTEVMFTEEPFRIPGVGVIEPDADGDGYGDETQDGCPQSAAYQTPCPVIVISALGQARRGAAIVHVATDLAAPVSVVGRVGMGKGRKATLRAKARQVAAGRLTRFKLNFPRGLRKRLARLPRGRKLTLRATASAPNIAGGGSVARVRLVLRGRGR